MYFNNQAFLSLERETALNGRSHVVPQNMQGFFFPVDFLPVCTDTAFQHFDQGQFCEIARDGSSFL